MAETLVPGPSRLEVEIPIAKLKKCNFKKAHDSVRREVLYNTHRVWGTHETSQVD
jgi:hypothetical protein